MSYIRETLQCYLCKKYINVSTGTFGGGVPSNCPFCNVAKELRFYSDGWRATSNGELDNSFEEKIQKDAKEAE